ncbi:MAG: hypothetical protein LBT20_05135 [Clostridiales bacterium]|jgi:diacylglycerol kinase family enzyme|nr:hypothetical protein [Clostridiales bacterium]
MKCLIINNPVSGHSKTEEQIAEIVEALKTKYETVDIVSTTETITATNISTENLGKYEVYVVLGGDGTFNEMLRGIAGKENRPLVGYIPSGTVNDFALCNKIPFNYKKAVDVILNGRIVPKSCMFINGIPADYVICAGMFSCSSYVADNSFKKKIGKLAYYHAIFFKDEGRHGERVEVTLPETGESFSALCTFIAGLNNSSIGGLRVTKQDFGNEDQFYFFMARRKKGFFPFAATLFAMLRVYIVKVDRIPRDTKHLVIRKVTKASVKTLSNTQWNVDGERGPRGDAEITYKQDQFSLFVP